MVKLLDFGLVQVQATGEVKTEAEQKPPEQPERVKPPSNKEALADGDDIKLTQAGHILGTPAYMSPEQALGEAADARSDVYGIGAVAYFLLTGKPPFLRATVAQIIAAHEKERPQPLSLQVPALEPALDAIIMRCLERDPGQRYQSVAALESALLGCTSAGGWNAEQAALWWEHHATAAPAAGTPAAAAGPAAIGPSTPSSDATGDLSQASANLFLSA